MIRLLTPLSFGGLVISGVGFIVTDRPLWLVGVGVSFAASLASMVVYNHRYPKVK